MSSKATPIKGEKPPLIDPHHVPETFSNEFIAAGIGQGIVNLTFATMRFTEGKTFGAEPRMERVVVSRLVLTNEAVNAMLIQLERLQQALKQQAALVSAKGEPVN